MSHADHPPKGPLRAIFDWLKRPPDQAPEVSSGAAPGSAPVIPAPARLGHYAIDRQLGRGGMGVVYAAHDEKLHRTVAIKTMSALGQDETARQRFWREARAAASVNHPNVCQIYEIGDEAGVLFIAMELLDGESLADRLKQGPMKAAETVSVGLGMLAALGALHARGIIHRDLKPSNVFLTTHGVKLLDFGLARPAPGHEQVTSPGLTHAGTVVGTPHYMSPEQALGQDVDSRTDLFAAGAILFEMLAGRPAFVGNTVIAILHATVYEEPPALTGPSSVAAIDRVIRRSLAKKPADRPASAAAMADELRDVRTTDSDTVALTHPMTRLVVLPFRILRPDPETDFLAFSLPDAITTSLSTIGSLVVRSSATAVKFSTEAPDFKALAAEVGVDRAVLGSLIRSGDELRVVAQLVETPAGTVITSHTVQSPLGNLFQLQDDIARRVVAALALPLGTSSPTPSPDAPADPRAYELYLRANELAREFSGLKEARDLYERCVALDPKYAPAWARLGRAYKIIGKFIEPVAGSYTRAEDAYKRALELNPRLTIAHKYYANLEADIGRAVDGMVRLLGEATRHGNDPELFSGLVHACRYCGLLEESLAAHEEGRRLDPNLATGFQQTILMMNDVDRMMSVTLPSPTGGDDGIRVICLGLNGRRDEARRVLTEMRQRESIPLFRRWTIHLEAWLDRRADAMLSHLPEFREVAIFSDPEAIFQEGWLLCDAGLHSAGMEFLERALSGRYYAVPALEASAAFDPLRGTPAFESLLNDARAGRAHALAAFREAGGDSLLGCACA